MSSRSVLWSHRSKAACSEDRTQKAEKVGRTQGSFNPINVSKVWAHALCLKGWWHLEAKTEHSKTLHACHKKKKIKSKLFWRLKLDESSSLLSPYPLQNQTNLKNTEWLPFHPEGHYDQQWLFIKAKHVCSMSTEERTNPKVCSKWIRPGDRSHKFCSKCVSKGVSLGFLWWQSMQVSCIIYKQWIEYKSHWCNELYS